LASYSGLCNHPGADISPLVESNRSVRQCQAKKLAYRWVPERGSGSHGTLYVGDRLTVVKDLKKELGPGLLSDMYKQLGIRKEDL
jgi:mRNA interferase HicA